MPGEQLTLATLNTRGIPVVGSRLAARYAAIGEGFNAGDADVVCFQEVFTYWHLRILAGRMGSFHHVSYRPSPVGPSGGLVTFSRRTVSQTDYRGFGIPPRAPGISRAGRFRAGLKGALVTRLARPDVRIVSTHPLANRDGDWSRVNRFYPLHRAQLAILTQVLRDAGTPVVVCGDFNVDRESSLFSEFLADSELSDAFGGGCPATFRSEYLPTGKMPCCIDFILTSDDLEAEAAMVLFAEPQPLRGDQGYVSDHMGLSARLFLTRP